MEEHQERRSLNAPKVLLAFVAGIASVCDSPNSLAEPDKVDLRRE